MVKLNFAALLRIYLQIIYYNWFSTAGVMVEHTDIYYQQSLAVTIAADILFLRKEILA